MITLYDLIRGVFPESVKEKIAEVTCRLFGHSKELEQKMYCKICSRCRVIVEYEVGSWG